MCHCATHTTEAGTCADETTTQVSTDVSCPFQFSSTAPKEPWKEEATQNSGINSLHLGQLIREVSNH